MSDIEAKSPTTFAEIGKIVGCSSATVSRALNNSGTVSPEIREAIFRIMRESKYSANVVGRRGRPLKRQQAPDTKIVEILYFRDTPIERLSMNQGGHLNLETTDEWATPRAFTENRELSSSFYHQLIQGASSELADMGYKAVVQISRDLTSSASLTEVNKPDRAGILLLGEYASVLDQFIGQCIHPLVLVDIIHAGRNDVVTTDNLAGMSEAFDHLYALGHRKIGFAGYRAGVVGFVERFNTYKLKMAEAGLPINQAWIYEGPNRVDTTGEATAKILARSDRPTAFLCANDVTAMGVIRAAATKGVRIPEDLSVIGFDDDEIASLVTPPLTTVHIPVAEMGRQAVRQLMLQILYPQSGRTRGSCVRLVPELIVRQSTSPVAAGR